jgi:glutathione S-transferase
MFRVFGVYESGNCYKVRLLLEQLGLPYEWVEIDILHGGSRTSEFLARNPNGRVPVLELEPGRFLAESNAILHYLAEGTPYLPAGRWERAQVLQWMFFEQYSHEPYIATSRYWIHFLGQAEAYREKLAEKRGPGLAALGVMEAQLAKHPFFVGDRYTIADIALYAYTHVAPEGGFALEPYPAVRAWIERVAAQPGHVGMREGLPS